MSTALSPAEQTDLAQVELVIGGMTCASCANRVERKLNKLDGVTATVNYATEKARVNHPPELDPAALVAQVEAAGYTAELPPPPSADPAAPAVAEADPTRVLRDRLIVSAVLAVPVVVLSMVPALQFTYWQWISLTLAAPVVVWGAWPFHRAAATNLRHGAATMDTLGIHRHPGRARLVAPRAAARHRGHARHDPPVHAHGGPHRRRRLDLPRGRDRRHRVHPARPLHRGPLQAAGRVGAARLARPGREGGRRPARNGRDARPGRRARRRRPLRRPARRDDCDRRDGRGRQLRRRRLHGHRRVGAGRGPPRRRRDRRHRQRGWPPRRGGHQGGRRDPARPDGPARRGGPERQGRRAAARRPRVRGVRAGRDRRRGRDAGFLARHRGRRRGGLHRGGGRPDHRLPLRAGPGHADRAAGRHRPRCPARDPDQGPGGAGVHPARRHDRARQDRHGHHGSDARARRAHRRGDLHRGRDASRRRRRAGQRAPRRPRDRRGGGGLDWPAARGRRVRLGSRPWRARGGRGDRRGRRRRARRPRGPPGAAGRARHRDARGSDGGPRGRRTAGRTAVAVAWDGIARAVIVVGDTVKPTSAEAVRELRRLGLSPVLLTGDNAAAALAVAAEVGIAADAVVAEVAPEDKVAAVRRLQGGGKVVAMVGDGVNDAAALAAADLGLAMGSGTDVAIEASDLTLVRGDLLAALDAIRLSRRTLAVIKGNLFWAFAYNVAALPLAAAGLLNPMIAGAAMAFSSVFVVTNSLRLRRFRASA